MKRCMVFLLTALLLCASAALAAPELTGVFADDVMLISGQDGWYFDFHTTEGGSLALQLLSGQTGEAVCDLGATQVEAGSGRICLEWPFAGWHRGGAGQLYGGSAARNYWGEESGQSLLSLHIYASEEEAAANVLDLSTLVAEEATGKRKRHRAAHPRRIRPCLRPRVSGTWIPTPMTLTIPNISRPSGI